MARHAHDVRRVLHGQPHAPQQGVGQEHGVPVHRAHVAVAREVQPAVQGVGLAAVDLVDHGEARLIAAAVDPAHRLGRQRAAVEDLAAFQLELAAQHLERAVPRAVIDDDHLELRVAHREQRAHDRRDQRLLVERRADHADRDREARASQGVEVLAALLAGAAQVLERRKGQHRREEHVGHDKVREAEQHGPAQHGHHRFVTHCRASMGDAAARSSPASRARQCSSERASFGLRSSSPSSSGMPPASAARRSRAPSAGPAQPIAIRCANTSSQPRFCSTSAAPLRAKRSGDSSARCDPQARPLAEVDESLLGGLADPPALVREQRRRVGRLAQGRRAGPPRAPRAPGRTTPRHRAAAARPPAFLAAQAAERFDRRGPHVCVGVVGEPRERSLERASRVAGQQRRRPEADRRLRVAEQRKQKLERVDPAVLECRCHSRAAAHARRAEPRRAAPPPSGSVPGRARRRLLRPATDPGRAGPGAAVPRVRRGRCSSGCAVPPSRRTAAALAAVPARVAQQAVGAELPLRSERAGRRQQWGRRGVRGHPHDRPPRQPADQGL